MTTYNTGNPLGSKDPRDLYDNAENLDTAVNTKTDTTWTDRLGVERKTFHGMEVQFDSQQVDFEDRFQETLSKIGYEQLGDYAAGLEITARNQIFRREVEPGQWEYYRADASLELPYTTTGDWGDEEGLFVAVGDAALRQELANPAIGAAMVARGVVAVDSIADLLVLPAEQRREDLRYLVKGYYAGRDVGGGEFYWGSGDHDGGLYVSPDSTSTPGSEAWYAEVISGPCFVRVLPGNFVTPEMYGAKGDRVANDYWAIRAAHMCGVRRIEYRGSAKYLINPPLGAPANGIPIYDGHVIEWNFCWIDCTANTHDCYALYYFNARQPVAPTRFRRFSARNVNLASSLGYPSEGSVTAPQYRHFLYIDGGWWQGVEIDGVFTPEGGEGLACRSAIMCDIRSLTGAEPGVPDECKISNINLHYGWSTPSAVVFLGDDTDYRLSRCDTVELDNILVASAPWIYDYHSFGTTNTRNGDFGAVMIDNCRFGFGPINRVFDKYTAVNTRLTGECNGTQFGWVYTEVKELRGSSRPATIKGKFSGCNFKLLKQWIAIFEPSLIGEGGAQLARATATGCTFEQLQFNGQNKNDQQDNDILDIPSDWFELLVGSRRNRVLRTTWAGRNDDNFNNSDVLQTKMKMPKGNFVHSNLEEIPADTLRASPQQNTSSELMRITYQDREYRDIYDFDIDARTTRGIAGEDEVVIRVVAGSSSASTLITLTQTQLRKRLNVRICMNQSVSKGRNRVTAANNVQVFFTHPNGTVTFHEINVPVSSDLVVYFDHPSGANTSCSGTFKMYRGLFYQTI